LEIPASWVEPELGEARSGAGDFAPSPGNRNVAGETLLEAFTPLQPVAARKSNENIANPASFQFNFTIAV